MSRLRTALTPFDIEQPSRMMDQLIEGIEKSDARKRKDLDKLNLFVTEMCDGYDGDADVGEGREKELTNIIAGIFENRRRYRQFKKKQLKYKRLLDSRDKTVLLASASKQSKSRSSAVKKGKRTAGGKSATSNKRHRADRGDQRQHEAIGRPGPSTTGAESMQARLYEDLMPRSGRQLLTAGEKRALADKLLRQLEDITNSRGKVVLAENYTQEFGDRRIFKYRQGYYVAICPIHPDLQLDYEGAKEHYESMHLVFSKNKFHHEMMRFFGTRIDGSSAAMEELIRKFCNTRGQERPRPGNIGPVMSDARSRTPEGGSTSEVARSETRRVTETDMNATATAATTTPRQNRETDQDVLPSSEAPQDGSRTKPARAVRRD
ncbi:hypothetical protein NLG97_g10424 [Lecanicillium saksenae]|uniref:Uncharacterized protein n=1 Tax=Lecanicillium saksenae TaxID=468837 RepID=A0ACC1QDG5_9HYPO|nr:hypothetical protein NLG97_g10424 [Lecanicillium saksenae]